MATEGLFTRENLATALAAVCSRVGVDPTGARLLRFTNNAVYWLADAPVVVRIVGSVALRHRVHKVVRVAEWFADNDVPAVRLTPGIQQPVCVGDYAATVWDAVPEHAVRPRAGDLARLLRVVHALPELPALPEWDPLDDVRRRLGEAEGLGDGDLAFLRARVDEVDDRLRALSFPLPRGLVHGDAHLGNLIPTPAGPVLCDFDSSCLGPPEWDLTPLAVGVSRFGEPAARYRELVEGYGFDVTLWSGFSVLREVRELKLITSVLPIMNSSPEVRPELLRRLRDFRTGDTSARWARYR
ncbi:phosphotransferase family protein [Actinokineospora globicatena]|uniref:phosphotransferase family protein n=1 Tax=Actinokineospora globicatena TaxID=103729 RepID=UPI0020A47048|nr:aminoglycoside phosphotransferase family protein [Actinokineospora globicatena]MCP2301216.1 Phosphotransferase enzyme family protein [Actinokineospora globicatena]GLW77148.1 aminoglycoside phosphotransferase [Actinokineospora globicatena]GLW83982.1 aminoglycoside phosphotransferase [Actinokineospora globicatena]